MKRAGKPVTFSDRLCWRCDSPAITVLIGQEEIREKGILLRRKMDDRNFCLACALSLPT
jgi:hypothetical protein